MEFNSLGKQSAAFVFGLVQPYFRYQTYAANTDATPASTPPTPNSGYTAYHTHHKAHHICYCLVYTYTPLMKSLLLHHPPAHHCCNSCVYMYTSHLRCCTTAHLLLLHLHLHLRIDLWGYVQLLMEEGGSCSQIVCRNNSRWHLNTLHYTKSTSKLPLPFKKNICLFHLSNKGIMIIKFRPWLRRRTDDKEECRSLTDLFLWKYFMYFIFHSSFFIFC